MKGKQNRLGFYMVMGMLLTMSMFLPKAIAFAGGINGNEASVISAASGTFSYNGKTYRAGSSHISSLTNYLAGDDIDLTAAQASEAISTMYANIAEGVAQGYLYEVGGSTTTEQESSEDEKTTEKDTNKKDDKKETEKPTDSKQPDTTTTEQKETSKENSKLDVWDTVSNNTEEKEKLKERPSKKKATVKIELQEDDLVVTKDNKTINLSQKDQLVSKRIILILDIVAGILLGITLLSGIILFATKCMRFRKQTSRKPRPGHSKRRKIRHYLRYVLTVTTSLGMIGLLLLLGIYISLFNENTIMQNMQSSGYFRYAYSEYITEESKKESFNAKELLPYEEYLFTVKQNSIKILNGNTSIRIPSSNVTPYIYNIKNSYVQLFQVAGVCMLLEVLLGVLLIIFMDQQRNRGLKNFAVVTIITSMVLILCTVIMAVNKPYLRLYIEPDYLYLFLMECIQWSVKVMTSITAFTVVLGALLMGAYKTTTNSKY